MRNEHDETRPRPQKHQMGAENETLTMGGGLCLYSFILKLLGDHMQTEIQPVKRIVRLLATDIDGNLSVERALRKIKGISFMFSRAVCIKSDVDRKKKIGLVTEAELKNLERIIKTHEMPAWMVNRRKDLETGKDLHVVMSDLDLKRREDINLLKRMHSYKGVRHELGQPVRGQRTRSSFRTSKSVGVSRKKIIAAAKPAPAAKPAEKK